MSEKWFKDFFNNANDGIFVFEIEDNGLPGVFVEVNEMFCKKSGYSREELLKMKLLDIVDQESLMKISNSLKKLVRFFEVTLIKKNGQFIESELSVNCFYHNNKKIAEAIARDLSERNITKESKNEQKIINENISLRNNLKKGFYAKYNFDDIISQSKAMKELIHKTKIFSKTDKSIMILGESGTGKELIANAIHNESLRKEGPFVALNCAAFSTTLIESELFGYSDGAFTGAAKGGKSGKIEMANNGTLFLDEIADLPLTVQAMLLRTLQENEIYRIGDDKITKVNFRIICASNKDLKQLCEENKFRWDLYYRLAGVILKIQPLRKRNGDIKILVNKFIQKLNEEQGLNKYLNNESIVFLEQYTWPGNVRELINCIETAYLLSEDNEITKQVFEDLLEIEKFVANKIDDKNNNTLADNNSKKARLIDVLNNVNGSVTKAAEILGVSRVTIYRWLKEIEEGK